MNRTTQTILHREGDFVPGNCLQAAVASLLDLPLDMVPHFLLFNDWEFAVRKWCSGRGLHWDGGRDPDVAWTMNGEFYILGGMSPRNVQHVVVARRGKIEWDPHPSRAGLLTRTNAYRIVPL